MNCCELLIAEHRRTEELMEHLDGLLRQMVVSGDPTRPTLPEIKTIYQTIADDLHRHYALEEKALFQLLSQYRTMMLMEVEHDDLLTLQNTFAQHLAQVTQGQPEYSAKSDVLLSRFQAFRDRLFAHILEEERGIFPLAEQVLEPEEKLKVLRLINTLVEAENPKVYDILRRVPGFSVQKAQLPEPGQKLSRPMDYQTLFSQDHSLVQTLRLQAGQQQSPHWAGQTQFFIVLEGEVRFETNGSVHFLGTGDTLLAESRLLFALSAITDSLLLMVKVWPHPHYTKG